MALVHGQGSGMAHNGSREAWAWACTNSCRTPCMATRWKASLKVITRPTTSTWPACRKRCKAQALSFPELHARRAFGFTLRSSQLVAAEQSGRLCVAIEISPAYAAAALESL